MKGNGESPRATLLWVSEPTSSSSASVPAALSALGYRVVEATGIDAARVLLDAQDADVVILDGALASAPLAALCSQLRNDLRRRAIPLAMVVHGDAPPNVDPLDAGVDELLVEPLRREIVRFRIERLLDPKRAGSSDVCPLPVGKVRRIGIAASREALLEELRGALERARTGCGSAALVGLSFRVEPVAATSREAAVRLASSIDEELQPLLVTEAGSVLEGEEAAGLSGSPVVARLGVRLFALLLPGVARPEDALVFGRRLRELLRRPWAHKGEEVRLVPSLGVATFPPDGTNAEEWLRRAETAAYCAHHGGHGDVPLYFDSMARWAEDRRTLEEGLGRAAERGELILHYQPRVEVKTRRIVGVEALVRWKHPRLGLVPPGQFIPLAERTGAIIDIGHWAIREACRQGRLWQDAGHAPLRVGINLSGAQFREPGLAEMIAKSLRATGLGPEWLEVEVTESVVMSDPHQAEVALRQLKSLGLRVALDDFGTGYSSLSYLRRFPVDALKIDQSFVREMTYDADDAAIVTAILLLGHSLRLRVVAEGVETDSQLSFLEVLECDEAQGFLIGRPVAPEVLEPMLAARETAAATAPSR